MKQLNKVTGVRKYGTQRKNPISHTESRTAQLAGAGEEGVCAKGIQVSGTPQGPMRKQVWAYLRTGSCSEGSHTRPGRELVWRAGELPKIP